MKKITIVFLWLFATVCIHGQNYYIDFTASGTTTTLDSVFVQNLTQSTSLTLGGSDTLHLIGTVDISEKSQNSSNIRIYPNPFNEKSYVEFYNETQAMISIDIYDVVGKNVFSLKQELEQGTHAFEMTGFATGHYQLIVKADSWQKTAAFVSLQAGNQNPQIQHRSSVSYEMQVKSTSKSTKNTIAMPYTNGDQMRFIGFSGVLVDDVNDIPTSSKTIDFVFASFSCGSIFIDVRDNNIYSTVQIGLQCWLAENLKYLPSVIGPATGSETTPYYYVYVYYGTDTSAAKATANYTTYGVLYNWPAAMASSASSTANPSGVQGICPTGWHLPSDAEWTQLTQYLGGEILAGGKLKEVGTTHWNSPNTGATNETGFTALPGGLRLSNGNFGTIGSLGYWWSATESDTGKAWFRRMNSSYGYVYRDNFSKVLGFSVRCIKDGTTSASLPTINTTTAYSITQTTAISGGNVTDDGGATVTARGVCWSTSQNPTLTDPHTTDGTSTGSFTSNITGLSANTTYYVRAYATNSVGTTYGNEETFTTAIVGTPIIIVNPNFLGNFTYVLGSGPSNELNFTVSGQDLTDDITITPPTNYDISLQTGVNFTATTPIVFPHTAGVVNNTTVYVRLAAGLTLGNYNEDITLSSMGATNEIVSLTGEVTSTPFTCGNSFTDTRDGNVYATVQIGTQCWMAKNLAYLPSVVGPSTGSDTIPYYYVYGYNGTDVNTAKATSNYTTYGVLYNWRAIMAGSAGSSANPSGVQGVCPTGWHLPSDAEWKQLEMFLGMTQAEADAIGWRGTDEGDKLKETGTTHWNSPNTGATNSSGFTALPGGIRYSNGTFVAIGNQGDWWTSTDSNTWGAYHRFLDYVNSDVGRYSINKGLGYSVRCLRD